MSFGVPAGSTVFRQGASCSFLYYLEEGWVALTRVEPTGTEVTIALRAAGSVLGMASAVSHAPHPVTSVAKTAIQIRQVPVALLEEGVQDDRVFCREVLREVGRESLAQVARCSALVCVPTRDQMIRLLQELTRPAVASHVPCPIVPADLAGLLGIHPVHARRLVRRLQREGILKTIRGRIALAAVPRLPPSAEA